MVKRPSRRQCFIALILLFCFCEQSSFPALASILQAGSPVIDCAQPGWFPKTFGLKDHTVFFFDGYTYIMSIYLPGEDRFAYARSKDWCDWEDLGPILSERTPGEPDEQSIWAPFVYEENGIYYAFFTGVTSHYTQSIMLAITRDPANPGSWQKQGVIFRPDHPQAIWTAGEWADCRDPMVIKVGGVYFLYYTGRDLRQEGEYGIVGLATATSPDGPWADQGAIINLGLVTPSMRMLFGMPESPSVYGYHGYYYLFYHDTTSEEKYRISSLPSGPWTDAYPISPGWAHEIWTADDGRAYASYLTDYTITISPVSWTTNTILPRPFLSKDIYQLFLPMTFK